MQDLKLLWDWLLSYGGIVMGGIAGIFSVVSKNKDGRLWRVLPIVGIVGGLAWGLASAYFVEGQQHQDAENAVRKMDDYIAQQSQQTVSQVDTNTRAALEQILQGYFGVLPTVAHNTTPDQALALASAGNSASNIIQGIPADHRQALTIWVFTHMQQEVNYSVVYSRLKLLAGTVEPHTPREQQSRTNSVWWHAGATLEDAKATALTATSAGLQIQQICPSTTVPTPDLIQIGGSVRAERLPVLSADQIQALRSPVCAQ